MKTIIKTICLCSFLMLSSLYAQQKPSYKVIKEEKLSDKDHDKTMYKITFKEGKDGKLCQDPNGKWWVHFVIGKDKGPFSKEEALSELHRIAVEGGAAAGQVGAGVAGGLTKKKILVDKNGNKYYLDKQGKKVYVK